MSSPAGTPRHVDPRAPVRLATGRYELSETITHQATSTTSTPRLDESTNEPYTEIPEGFLAAETGSASFSFASTAAKADNAEAATISCLDMICDTSNHIVMGDSSGRMALYVTSEATPRRHLRRFWHQAFIPEIDCLRSAPIEERVTCGRLLPKRTPAVTTYLAANARNIKLYRMREDVARPRSKTVVPLSVFTGPHKHAPIHSLALCADAQTFLSADDFQVQWWHLDGTDQASSCLVDIHPADMGEISELLTAAAFHPSHGSLFLTASSNGWTAVGDLRDPPSRSERHYSSKLTLKPEHNIVQCEHDDILCSVADAAFLHDTSVVTRDYLSMKLWDLRRPTTPVAQLAVHECLADHLSELYDSDAVFDRFGLAVDTASGTVITGLYDARVALWRPESTEPAVYVQASVSDDSVRPATSMGALEWRGDDAFVANRVTNVSIANGGETVAFSCFDKLFVFDRVTGTQA